MKNITFKKILILENEYWDANKGNGAYRFYEHLKDAGVEFKIIERAAHTATDEELVNAILWCDAILFASTFLYAHDVKGIGDLMMKVPMPKSVIGYPMSSRTLEYHLESIWATEELAKMSHHKVYQLDNGLFDDDVPEDEILRPINMQSYKDAWDKEVAELEAYNHSFKPTGRKVRIRTVVAVGPQWSLLKEGDIVDELDCTEKEPNGIIKRGIWVMGKDEPVKLLNDSGYDEWEFEELTAENLTYEFFSRGAKLDLVDLMETVESWIYHALGKIMSGEGGNTEVWDWCDTLCNTVGVERRGNRRYFEEKLHAYNKKYTYFKEPKNDPMMRVLARQASRKKALREAKARVKFVGQNPQE